MDNGLGDRVSQTVNGITTNFVLDLNSGLTQVLQESAPQGYGAYTYLYGTDRIAQYGATSTEYFLGDALGSVRQMVDASGAVILAKSYDPYGNVKASTGTGASRYGYTGEQSDSYIKLIYLRSRYYSPVTGRFQTRDTWQGDYNTPMSYNAWLYGYANPIKYTDPSGHVPLINQYDLTNWFYEELKFNVNHIYTKQIRTLRSSVGNLSPADKLRADFGWVYLVKDKAKWDFKHKIEKELRSKSIVFQHEGGYDWYEYSMPGNIFYGFIGKAAGFSNEMLHLGAGYAEVKDPAHKDRGEACCPKICGLVANEACLSLGCYYFNPEWANTFYDDPLDYQAVEFGIQLYENTRERITLQSFQTFLSNNRSMLTKGTPMPYAMWSAISDDVYEPGHFDGPDTGKNAPVVNSLLLWPPLAND